jgi:hypothetical protein
MFPANNRLGEVPGPNHHHSRVEISKGGRTWISGCAKSSTPGVSTRDSEQDVCGQLSYRFAFRWLDHALGPVVGKHGVVAGNPLAFCLAGTWRSVASDCRSVGLRLVLRSIQYPTAIKKPPATAADTIFSGVAIPMSR